MNSDPSDTTTERTATPPEQRENHYARYGAFNTSTGSVVIYDEENSQAWIQSDSAVDIGTRA